MEGIPYSAPGLHTVAVTAVLGLLAACGAGMCQSGMISPPKTNFSHDGGTAVLLKDGAVLIAGDDSGRLDLYDPASNSFAGAEAMPKMETGRERPTVTRLANGKVLIAGGWGRHDTLTSTELYDPAYRCFAGRPGCPDRSAPPPMNVSRAEATATLLPDGKVLIAGGCSGDPTAASFEPSLNSTELYDPVSNTFAAPDAAPRMNTGRSQAVATLLPNGKVLIAGGEGAKVGYLSSAELYDPVSHTFAAPSATPTMNVGRSQAAAVLLPNDKVLIAGGSSSPLEGVDSSELYDVAENCFAGFPGCPDADRPPRMTAVRPQATATLLRDGRVLIAGGGGYQAASFTADLYDPATNTFGPADAAPVMNHGRYHATAVALPDGKVLIAGGSDSDNQQILAVELYDPARHCFLGKQCGDPNLPAVMNTVHADPAALLLPTGKVLVVGGAGYTNFDEVHGAELYDPATNSFAPPTATPNVGSLLGATLALLPNGEVLIAGGYSTRRAISATSLYNPRENCFSFDEHCPNTPAPPPLETARGDASATLLPDGLVLIAGGSGDSAELYDPAHNCFAGRPDCPQKQAPGAMNTGRWDAATVVLPGGKVLIVGGNNAPENGPYTQLTSMELYNPRFRCFAGHRGCGDKTRLPAMRAARAEPTATLLPDGRVLVAGGYNERDGYLQSAELYDPVHNCLAGSAGCPDRAAPPAMNVPRSSATAMLLGNGKVLVAGGVLGHTQVAADGHRWMKEDSLNTTELYDPESNRFAPPELTPTMNCGRRGAAAIRLPGGKVLIIGGIGGGEYELLSTTELYDPGSNRFLRGVCPARNR